MKRENRKTLLGFFYGIIGALIFLTIIAIIYFILSELQPLIDYYIDQGIRKITSAELYTNTKQILCKFLNRFKNLSL